MDCSETFGTASPVIGMVHLPALPGAPGYEGDREAIRERAIEDARELAAGGVDGLMVENFGDAPFYPEDVPKHVVAEMTDVVGSVVEAVDLPVGVNVLRNDAEAALSVAAAAGASLIRVNVHTGAQVTDQGLIEGCAHETVRLRERLDADVAILADVAVKHAAPLAERPLDAEIADLLERGHADGLVVSGSGTGERTDSAHLRAAVEARDVVDPEVPVFVGSGVTPETVAETLAVADGAIVGTALKSGGETTAPVDREAVEALLAATDR